MSVRSRGDLERQDKNIEKNKKAHNSNRMMSRHSLNNCEINCVNSNRVGKQRRDYLRLVTEGARFELSPDEEELKIPVALYNLKSIFLENNPHLQEGIIIPISEVRKLRLPERVR